MKNNKTNKITEFTGYNDEIHFMKTFKKYFVTPHSKYRQGLKRKNKKA